MKQQYGVDVYIGGNRDQYFEAQKDGGGSVHFTPDDLITIGFPVKETSGTYGFLRSVERAYEDKAKLEDAFKGTGAAVKISSSQVSKPTLLIEVSQAQASKLKKDDPLLWIYNRTARDKDLQVIVNEEKLDTVEGKAGALFMREDGKDHVIVAPSALINRFTPQSQGILAHELFHSEVSRICRTTLSCGPAIDFSGSSLTNVENYKNFLSADEMETYGIEYHFDRNRFFINNAKQFANAQKTMLTEARDKVLSGQVTVNVPAPTVVIKHGWRDVTLSIPVERTFGSEQEAPDFWLRSLDDRIRQVTHQIDLLNKP